MTTNMVDTAFIQMFQPEVKLAYQRLGSKLRGTVRTVNGFVGYSTRFQKMGTAVAVGKTRHGRISPSNVDHNYVDCSVADRYSGEWIDKLDLLKTNIDERGNLARLQAAALGRAVDNDLITAWQAAVTATSYTTSITLSSEKAARNSVLAAKQAMAERDIPMDDNQLYVVISPSQESALMTLEQFSNARYVGPELPYVSNVYDRRTWLGAHWITHTGLGKSGNNRTGFMYHYSSTGHAIQADIQSDATWHGDHYAWWVVSAMSMGAVAIDTNGIQGLVIDESAALPTS